MVLNTLLAAGKLFAGIIGHSHALIADAIESLADVFSSIVVWRAMVVAEEPADEDHPYGHGKAEPIASAIVSTMLLLAAAGIAFNSAHEFFSGERHTPKAFTLAVLIFVIIIKEALYRFVSKEAKSVDSSAVRTDAWHHRSDAITSLCAAIGITISLIGGKGYETADDIAAIVAAGIIAWNGWHLLRPALSELMDRSPGQDVIDKIRRTAADVPGVQCIEKCMVRKVGHRYYADMHVQVDPLMTVQRGHAIAHDVKDQIRAAIPAVRDVLIHIEPSPQKR
ncbi:cation diffusion facilitator family transporter [Pedosphaera parvula Ellin514]|uniref:Cation diffusion facilitator family transporter n=2 Tax=Pedosphaera TaxID=1032526 RepID=B9XCG9_PEDPL|nr:cation diffusion facilitator family transporter [Pedosphaera parvula Ellin514]